MREKTKNQYNSLYENRDNPFGEGKPLEQVEAVSDYFSSGSVLDIGGGDGRNALYLSEQGFDVTVNDLSEVGIDKLQSQAEEKGLDVKTEVCDVLETGISHEHEVIILSFVMHHMDVDEAHSLLNEVKEKTVAGGVNVIATFANEGYFFERHKDDDRFYPSEEMMRDLYGDWEILDFELKDTKVLKEGETNLAVYMTARKPEANEPEQE